MAENTDIQEIPQEGTKDILENSKEFIENVLGSCTLKNPEIFRRNIGGRKKWADLKNPKKGKEEPKIEIIRSLEEVVGDLKEYRENSQDWKKEEDHKEKPKMVEIFDAGLKTPWGDTEEERQKKLMNSGKIIKIKQVRVNKKPMMEQKQPIKIYKLGPRLNQSQISAILDDDSPIDMRVSGPSRVAKIQATRMINSGAQSQYSDNIEAQLDAHFKPFKIPKYSGMGGGNSAGYSSNSRPISPVFEAEKGQCPMCQDMISIAKLPAHAALCEGTPMYIKE